MSISGNLTPEVIRLAMTGRSSLVALLSKLITVDYIIKAYIKRYADDDDASALVTKNSDLGTIQVLVDDYSIFMELTALEKAALSNGWVYALEVRFIDASDETTVLFTQTFFILPTYQFLAEDYTTLPSSIMLSTRFLNTLALTGASTGAGKLNSVVTVNQPVGCIVEFAPQGQQPQEWILEVWASAAQNTLADAYQQPLDFNAATNAKVWRRIV